jgi:hypothetical protein
MAGIFSAKLWNGQVASFVRSDGELLIVSVAGQERTISRDMWRQLPEQHDRVQHREHGHGRQGPADLGLRRSDQ